MSHFNRLAQTWMTRVQLAAAMITLPAMVSFAQDSEAGGIQASIDQFFGALVGFMAPVLFFTVPLPFLEFQPREDLVNPPGGVPLIVLILFFGGLFFTIRYSFMNLRLFKHAIYVVRGHFDDPNEKGEITHFQALTSALAATVGLGNIGGVALAITAGGPGAIFWMWLTAFLGMSMKFSSCTLAQLYREEKPDGHIVGGPMVYLRDGIKEVAPGLAPLGIFFSYLFAVLTICAAFGGGNMFQVQQSYAITAQTLGLEEQAWFKVFMGLVIASLVALVVIGGIKRIGKVTSALVPAMCAGYCAVCLIIILSNFSAVPALLGSIFVSAFSSEAIFGGFLGVLVQGMKRAAFSNEAGLGSAAIAHACAKTHEPVREGTVAMLGPFIDTIVVCTMTALAILITGAHLNVDGLTGVTVTANAFTSVWSGFEYFLMVAVFIFAYSTLISWGFYGERAVEFLFGQAGLWPYRVVFVLVCVVSPMLSLTSVVDFADMMLLSMAFPNILGMIFLSGKVKAMADDYVRRLKSGEMQPYK